MLATKEKHIKLADILSEKVKNKILLPGEKIPSHRELGKKYSMSRTSVYYAFNELEKRGIITRRPGKGIYVKEAGDNKKFKTISVIMPEKQFSKVRDHDNFGLEILMGIEKGLRAKGLECRLRAVNESEQARLADIISELNPDGIILARCFSDDKLEKITKLGVPVAVAGRIPDLPEISGTAPNIFDYYSKFCRKLISEGNKKITILSREDLFVNSDFELVANFIDKQIKGSSVKIIQYAEADASKADNNFIYDCVQRLVDDNDLPDVFIGATDWVAFRIIEKLYKLGISIPDDIRVVGCLDIDLFTGALPEITTFRVDPFELGRRAVEVLCKLKENNNKPIFEKISMEYIEKETLKIHN